MASPLDLSQPSVALGSRSQQRKLLLLRNDAAAELVLPAAHNAIKLRPLYVDFLNDMCFANSPASCNPDRERVAAISIRLSAVCGSWIPPRLVSLCATAADTVYRYHPLEVQIKIAHFTIFTVMMDDLAGDLKGEQRERYMEDLTLFHHKLMDPGRYAEQHPGRGELHPVCEAAIVFLKSDLSPFFATDNRLHSLLVKSFLEFLEGQMLEQHYVAHPLDFTGAADLRFLPVTVRRKSGMSEPYAFFVIMNTTDASSKDEESFFYSKLYPLVPELVAVFDHINDILSFYKEVENGEDDNCIFNDAKVHGVSAVEALAVYAQYVVDARNRLIALVDKAQSAEIKKRVLRFFQGYMTWHLGNRRYRGTEVLPDGWYKGELFG